MRIDYFTTKNDETVELGDFTVLVGPNNTGKSQTLLDIHSIMASNRPPESTQTTIVSEIKYQSQSFSDFIEELTIAPHPDATDRKRVRGIHPNLQGVNHQDFNDTQLEQLQSSGDDFVKHRLFRNLTQFKVALLDASSRLTIAESTETYNLSDGHPTNILQKLYTAPQARQRLREAFQDTFGKDILLDFSSLREFILRISDDFGENENHLLEPPEDHSE